MPSPYQLKLSIQRMKTILDRILEQKRLSLQEQHRLRSERQQQELNKKKLHLNQVAQKSALDLRMSPPSPSFRPSRKKQPNEYTFHSKQKTKLKAKTAPIQDAFFYVLGFFARKENVIQKKLNQEKFILKQAREKEIAAQERHNNREF